MVPSLAQMLGHQCPANNVYFLLGCPIIDRL